MKNLRGFTLIELILYISIISMVMVSLIPFAWNVIGGGVKSSMQQEVFSQSRYLSERIKYEIRNAIGINTVGGSSISLVNADSTKNPTVITFTLGTNQVTIAQGPGSPTPVRLHSTDTTITALSFINYTSGDNKTEHIQFTFTIDDAYTGARQEYEVPSLTLESSAEVRSN